jgi:hypothetical protein
VRVIFLYVLASVLTLLSAMSFYLGRDSVWEGWFIVGFIIGIVAGVVIAMAIIAPVNRKLDENACHSWGQQTGREVRFSAYAYGGLQWDCFVRTSDGNWLPKSQLRDVAP